MDVPNSIEVNRSFITTVLEQTVFRLQRSRQKEKDEIGRERKIETENDDE